MTEQGFLTQLKSSLGSIPAQETEEIVADYIEHFAAGRANGAQDPQIAASLGNPKTIGRSYQVESALGSSRPAIRRFFAALFASVSLGLFNVIFVMGPFIALTAMVVSLWIVAVAVAVSGVAVVFGILLQPVLPQSLSLAGLNIGFLLFASIGAAGIGFLSILGMWQLSRFLARGTGKYLKFNAQFIRKPKEADSERK